MTTGTRERLLVGEQFLANFIARGSGKLMIQQDQIGLQAASHLQSLFGIRRQGNSVA